LKKTKIITYITCYLYILPESKINMLGLVDQSFSLKTLKNKKKCLTFKIFKVQVPIG